MRVGIDSFCQSSQFTDSFPVIGRGENSISCHKNIATCLSYFANGVDINTSINFNINAYPFFTYFFPQALNFRKHRGNKFLPAKPRINGHDKDHIHIRKDMIKGSERSGRVKRYSSFTTLIFNKLNTAMKMRRGFHMDRNDVSPGFCKFFDILIRVLDHEVYIKGKFGYFSKGSHDRRTDRDIGNKVTVHYINMDPVSPPFFNCSDFFTQPGKVSK